MSGLRRLHHDQAGISVVELLVTVLIFSVVGVGLATSAISLTRATAKVDAMTTDQGSGRNAMAVLSRDLRAAVPIRRIEAPAFVDARTHGVEFTALLGSSTRPQLVRFYLDEDNRFVEDVTPSNGGTLEDGTLEYDTEDAVVRNITTYVVNRADEPIFRYWSGSEELSAGASGLSDADRTRVTAVEVRLLLSSDPSGLTGRYEMQNRIRLPNVQYLEVTS